MGWGNLGIGLGAGMTAFNKTLDSIEEREWNRKARARQEKAWKGEDDADAAFNQTTPVGQKKFTDTDVYGAAGAQTPQQRALQEQSGDFGESGRQFTAAALNSAQGAPQIQASQTQSQAGYLDDLQQNMRSANVPARTALDYFTRATTAAKGTYELKGLERAESEAQNRQDALALGRTWLDRLTKEGPDSDKYWDEFTKVVHSADPKFGGADSTSVALKDSSGQRWVALTQGGATKLFPATPENVKKAVDALVETRMAYASPADFRAAVETSLKREDLGLKAREVGAKEQDARTNAEFRQGYITHLVAQAKHYERADEETQRHNREREKIEWARARAAAGKTGAQEMENKAAAIARAIRGADPSISQEAALRQAYREILKPKPDDTSRVTVKETVTRPDGTTVETTREDKGPNAGRNSPAAADPARAAVLKGIAAERGQAQYYDMVDRGKAADAANPMRGPSFQEAAVAPRSVPASDIDASIAAVEAQRPPKFLPNTASARHREGLPNPEYSEWERALRALQIQRNAVGVRQIGP